MYLCILRRSYKHIIKTEVFCNLEANKCQNMLTYNNSKIFLPATNNDRSIFGLKGLY